MNVFQMGSSCLKDRFLELTVYDDVTIRDVPTLKSISCFVHVLNMGLNIKTLASNIGLGQTVYRSMVPPTLRKDKYD